jgi:putative hydrolase of the HAD superfamily
MPPLRAISFDVGGTLVEPWPSVGHVYAAVAAEVGLPAVDPGLLNAQFASAWRARLNFDYSRQAWADVVVSTFGGTAAQFGLASPLFERLYHRFAEADAWKLHPDVVPTFELLRQRGLKLAAVSNWDDRLRPLLHNLGLDQRFDTILVSAETGFHKPAAEIFHRAVRELGVLPGEVLHVGDSLQEDFHGARAAGLNALLLRRGGVSLGADEIGSLEELAGWLEGDGRRGAE